MNSYNFNQIKEDIVNQVGNDITIFDKCFIVRNVFSRFVLYVENAKNIDDFKNQIKEKFDNWVDFIQEISKNDNMFIYQDLEKTSNITKYQNVFFSERYIDNTNWSIKTSTKPLKTPVISFYSFKGGVGRTTATVLTALLLARKGKKVLLIDFDLEAPGLASIFANEDNSQLLEVKGFIDFLIDYEANKKNIDVINFDDYYFLKNDQSLVGREGGEIFVVPAISTDTNSASSYIDKLSKINIKYGFGENYLPDFFLKKMEEKINPDFILIDTRTGINDVGGLVFNHYAQNIFLFFYGNQQNMFGLESIISKLKGLHDINFYLINSPVPKNETDAENEIYYYLERSYEIFCNNFYESTSDFPSRDEESAQHYPINIPFTEQALILDNDKKIMSLIEGNASPYQEIADIILRNFNPPKQLELSNKSKQLDTIINIDKGAGTSEIEYQKEDDLKKYFYPRTDYKYIFDKDKFLILGEKGVGKTALFSVLSHPNYAKALAEFCGVSDSEIKKIEWIIGIQKDEPRFPSKENFNALSDFLDSELRNYWMILLFQQLDDTISDIDIIKELKKISPSEIKDKAKEKLIGEQLYQNLIQINENLKKQNKIFIVVYDYLDVILSNEKNIRGNLVSALLSFYYENMIKLSNIKAKIFLRNDIFEREVNNMTDKVKVQNYAVEIKWDYNQLLNIIWKRIYEQDSSFFKELENIQKPHLFNPNLINQKEILGTIPNIYEKSEHEIILNKIFGQAMGGNNKTYPYNWVKTHIEDTNGQIHPRTLIKLFSESAKLQKEDNMESPNDRLIRSRNIESALKTKVSKQQIQEIGEEYSEFKIIFTNLVEKVENGRSPINEEDLKNALKELGFEDTKNTIDKLQKIGLLKEYKTYGKKNTQKVKRYHIPDLYLHGLGFTRLGTN